MKFNIGDTVKVQDPVIGCGAGAVISQDRDGVYQVHFENGRTVSLWSEKLMLVKRFDEQIRTFAFNNSAVSCLNCRCNYPSPLDPPDKEYGAWCQVWSFGVPDDEKSGMERAKGCTGWIPRCVDRSKRRSVDAVNPDRWYERDSMG